MVRFRPRVVNGFDKPFYGCRRYDRGIGDEEKGTGPLLSQSLVSSPVLGCLPAYTVYV